MIGCDNAVLLLVALLQRIADRTLLVAEANECLAFLRQDETLDENQVICPVILGFHL